MAKYGLWKVWSDGEDWIVAMDRDGVRLTLIDTYGEPEDGQIDAFEVVPPDRKLTVWEDYPGHNEQVKTAAEWASISDPGLLASANL